MHLCRLLTLLFLFSFFAPLSSLSVLEKTEYPAFCQKAAEQDEVFATFKRAPIYRSAIEHVSYEQGIEYLKIIEKEYPELLNNKSFLLTNDVIGDPIKYFYPKMGWLSPTTLRYLKIAGDLISEFGELKDKRVVEIGGDYGVLCKILHDLGGFKSYTRIDLPEANQLVRRYLQLFKVPNTHFIDSTHLDEAQEYDLVISHFGFSQMDRHAQAQYLEKVILKTPLGFMPHNFIASMFFGFDCYHIQEIIDALIENGRMAWMENEVPSTGFVQRPNLIIKWQEMRTK